MKNILGLLSTDWHLKDENTELIKDLIIQKCKKAKELKIKNLFCLGDVLNSRIAQRQKVLLAFKEILDIINDYGLELYVIPGNHDKTNYSSYKSFLNPYEGHPALKLMSEGDKLDIIEGIRIHFMPYLEENMWLEEFKPDLLSNIKNVLLTHMAFEGSVNNDGSLVSTPLKPKLFKKFDLVLSGHYHDEQTLAPNMYHIPSICQGNFGEDEVKGFTILYDDLTFEIVKSDFPIYKKISIDINKISSNEIVKMAEKETKNLKDNIRFEFSGDEAKLKNIDKNFLNMMGVDVKIKIASVEIKESIKKVNLEKINKSQLLDEFKDFCEQEKLDYEEGVELLNVNYPPTP
jgi:exonuclease SbcD